MSPLLSCLVAMLLKRPRFAAAATTLIAVVAGLALSSGSTPSALGVTAINASNDPGPGGPVAGGIGGPGTETSAAIPVGNVTWLKRPLANPAGLPNGSHWIATWGASAQAPSSADLQSMSGFKGQTLREVVLTSSEGTRVRVHLTNAYGSQPLVIGRAAVAIAARGAAVTNGSSRELSFAGKSSVTIPPGGSAWSDPVKLTVPSLSKLAVSIFLPSATGPATEHAQAHETNYLAGGAHVFDGGGRAFGTPLSAWYFLDAVQLWSPNRDLGAVVALGDSITSGVGSRFNGWASWPDDLARRLAAAAGSASGASARASRAASTDTLSVIDEGIGGNRVLNDSPCCGQSALGRFDSEVQRIPGVREVILLEGINDISYSLQTSPLTAPHTDVSAQQIIAGYQQLINAAHHAHLQIWGVTLLPFEGARYWTTTGEAKRDAINNWILHSGAFDGVINLAKVVADPFDQQALNPAYDSGDHLHPNSRGYQAMANAINLSLLLR